MGSFSFKNFFSWSYGIVLFEMFSFGEVPYSELNHNEILPFLEAGQRLKKPTYCPNEM
jgi:hypothetical protein